MSYDKAKEVEKDLIVSHKELLDKNNKCCRPRILEKKCDRCGQVHPIVRYKWYSSLDGFPSLLIQIPVYDEKRMKDIFEAEEALSKIGIHFDTGYGGVRDWEFDWSLSGEQFLSGELINRDSWKNKIWQSRFVSKIWKLYSMLARKLMK